MQEALDRARLKVWGPQDASFVESGHLLGWSGGDFDADRFNLIATNVALQRLGVLSASGENPPVR